MHGYFLFYLILSTTLQMGKADITVPIAHSRTPKLAEVKYSCSDAQWVGDGIRSSDSGSSVFLQHCAAFLKEPGVLPENS